MYTDVEGERRYLPQYFKFSASNPLAVRTKVRPGREGSTLLEACIENATRAPLLLSSATFEPSAHLECTMLTPPVVSGAGVVFPTAGSGGGGGSGGPGGGGGSGGGGRDGGGGCGWGAPDASGGGVGLPSLAGRALHVLAPSGGSTHFLFELRAKDPRGADGAHPLEGGNTLGKLEICWKGNMGEAGRLQTQQILGAPRARKDVELSLIPAAPTRAKLGEPLVLQCVVRNRTQKKTLPLELIIQPPPSAAAAAAAGTGAAGGGGGGGGKSGGADGRVQ